MKTFTTLRRQQGRILLPLTIFIVKRGIHPNTITLLSLFLAILGCTLIVVSPTYFVLAMVLLIISFILDLIDGSVARLSQKVTNIGDFIDCISDRLIDSLVIISLFFGGYCNAHIALVAITVILLISHLSTQSRANFGYEAKGGFMSRSGRGVILVIAFIIHSISPSFKLAKFSPFDLSLLFIIFAGIFTYIGRLRLIIKHARQKNLII